MKETYRIEPYKKKSEDIIEIFSIENKRVYILCDGAGGYGGGLKAATLSARMVKKSLLTEGITRLSLITAIRNSCFKLLSRNIGQTTMIVIAIEDNEVVGASCGDSDAHLLLNDKSTHITKDQINLRIGDLCVPTYFEYDDFDKIIIGSDGLWFDCSIKFIREKLKDNTDREVIDEAFKKVEQYEQQDDFSCLIISKK
jgi:serine/threonine protein phosphatase PrpC